MNFSKPLSKKWAFHVCGFLSLDGECREFGVSRLHVNTPWTHVTQVYWPTSWRPNVDWVARIREAQIIE